MWRAEILLANMAYRASMNTENDNAIIDKINGIIDSTKEHIRQLRIIADHKLIMETEKSKYADFSKKVIITEGTFTKLYPRTE